MSLRFFNTLGRRIEEFIPLESPKVGLYTCGPTVYNYAHLGNYKCYIFEDVLRRTLDLLGYEVKHVMNITDVGHLVSDEDEGEDKMEIGARRENKTPWEIAEYYEKAFFNDINELNILPPHIKCKATDHVQDMIALIARLEARGLAYSSGGNVYFDVEKFRNSYDYSKLDTASYETGKRIEEDKQKKSPCDFVLWFTKSKFEGHLMNWDSPWGYGYPGWHIECSAMSMKYLGEQFDIHCGGVDHIPVHHTNEIAQSEGATGKIPWVKYWLHNEFLITSSEKMSKSSGEFLTLTKLKNDGFKPLSFRYLCLSAHYRSQLQYNDSAIENAEQSYNRLFNIAMTLKEESAVIGKSDDNCLLQFKTALEDDLNTPQALAIVWGMLRDKNLSSEVKWASLIEFDKVLGFGFAVMEKGKELLPLEIENLIKEREISRKNKDYSRADEIRKMLLEKGIILQDTPQGVKWEKL